MNLAGDLYMERKNFPPAGDWYKKGLDLVRNDPPHLIKALLLENMGHYFWKTKILLTNIWKVRHNVT